jgi:hypothetical protein
MKLMEKDLLGAEFARQIFRAVPPAGTKIEEMLNPAYWAHVAKKFNPHDMIEVVPADGAFYARLIVLSVGHLSMKVQALECVVLVANPKVEKADAIAQFEVNWGGPNAKWRVLRKSDGAAVTTESFQTQGDAQEWINKNFMKMAA